MKHLKFGIFAILITLFGSSCLFFKAKPKEDKAAVVDNTKPITWSNLTDIVFGWGGGFTGMIEEYHLAKDGTLKVGSEIKKKVDSKSMKIIVAAFKKVNFSKIKINDPGNLYYFMAAKAGTNEQRLIWNDQTQLPPEVKAAYDELVKITK